MDFLVWLTFVSGKTRVDYLIIPSIIATLVYIVSRPAAILYTLYIIYVYIHTLIN